MSTPNPISKGDQYAALLKADFIVSEGPILATFIQNFLAAKTALGRVNAWAQFRGEVMGGLTKAGDLAAGQVDNLFVSKITEQVAGAQAEIDALTKSGAATAASPAKP